MNQRSLSEFVRSRIFIGIIIGVGSTLLVLCIFQAGIAVGYHEATFSSQWSQNYAQNFGGADYGMDERAPTAHGTTGKVLSISTIGTTTTMIVESSSRPEQKVLIGSDTTIRSGENTVTPSALTTGTYAVIIGTPNNQGVIEAKLIRILPVPNSTPSTGSANGTSSPYAAP